MGNLNIANEAFLKTSLEGPHWGSLVILIGPDGARYDKGNDGDPLKGQVVKNPLTIDPISGFPVTGTNPTVTLRKSNLQVVPKKGEDWSFLIPSRPTIIEPDELYYLEKSIKPNDTMGIVTYSLTKTKQK